MRRVVITGMGAITPVGLSVEEFWNSVKEGKTNFAEVTRLHKLQSAYGSRDQQF